MKQPKKNDQTSTSYMKGWKDKKAGNGWKNPYDVGSFEYKNYDRGYNDAPVRKFV